MPPSGSSRSSKPKPAEVAAKTKRLLKDFTPSWPAYSYFFTAPLTISSSLFPPQPMNLSPPSFFVRDGDPVDFATCWSAANGNVKVAFICAANENRPGGDWETGVSGYEERLCRRSSLSAHLAKPGPGADPSIAHYPIKPSDAGIYSDRVVVFRGPHDRYEQRERHEWRELPVVSVPPIQRPRIKTAVMKYAFEEERELAKRKLRAALTICVYNGIGSVVIGDFGLGSCRNPPQEMAEMWRNILLWDPNLRGRIENVAFVFEDRSMSTMRLIVDENARKSGKSASSSGSSSRDKGKGRASSSSASSGGSGGYPTDYEIFSHVFSASEITRVLTQPDDRMVVPNLMS